MAWGVSLALFKWEDATKWFVDNCFVFFLLSWLVRRAVRPDVCHDFNLNGIFFHIYIIFHLELPPEGSITHEVL